jgi:uncharacterized membrane protein YedE/YeeE
MHLGFFHAIHGRAGRRDNVKMTELNINGLTQQVLWSAFALALVFGAVAHRTHFCTMGAVADVVNMGDWARARMWGLAMAIAILGFNAMVAAGWLEARNSIYAAPRLLWASCLAGGLMFGFGMVLASGCGSKNLVRLGGGSLKALVVLLVLGLSALVTLRGLTAVLRVNTVDALFLELAQGQDLPSVLSALLGTSVRRLAGLLGAVLAFALLIWVFYRREGRSAEVVLGGVGIGGVIVAVWWVSGRLGFVPEDPSTLEPAFLGTNSHRMESFSLVSPVGYLLDWLMFFSDKSKVLTLGIVSVLGIPVGACLDSLFQRSFRWESFGGIEDLANHLVGAALMGVGGVVALGCTIGQGLSGISTLSIGSLLTVIMIIAGAVLALHYQSWRLEVST